VTVLLPQKKSGGAQVYQVLVTGNRHAVAQEAARRGVPFAFKRETRVAGRPETTGYVGLGHEIDIARWFNETLSAPTLSVLAWEKVPIPKRLA